MRGRPCSSTIGCMFERSGTNGSDARHIYRKLGVSDRTAAVTTALERQIIRLDDA